MCSPHALAKVPFDFTGLFPLSVIWLLRSWIRESRAVEQCPVRQWLAGISGLGYRVPRDGVCGGTMHHLSWVRLTCPCPHTCT